MRKQCLVVLDFDGFMLNSYEVIRQTMLSFGLDPGDEERFRNRRKFLKYLGGGKEVLGNLVRFPLPSTKRLRRRLTECYRESALLYPAFRDLVNGLIAHPQVHVGVVSRNFALDPGETIRTVMYRSGVEEGDLDFVIPLPVGVRKGEVLAGMHGGRFVRAILGGDEIGDFRCGLAAGYDCVIGSYGFDTRPRLTKKGEVPDSNLFDSPEDAARGLLGRLVVGQVGSARSLKFDGETALRLPMGARKPANAAELLAQE